MTEGRPGLGTGVRTAAIVVGAGLLVAAVVYIVWGFGWWVGGAIH